MNAEILIYVFFFIVITLQKKIRLYIQFSYKGVLVLLTLFLFHSLLRHTLGKEYVFTEITHSCRMSEIFGKEKSEWKLSQKEPDLQKCISLMSEQEYSSNYVFLISFSLSN